MIPGPCMYILFKKSTRGGTSYTSNKSSKDNNKHLKSNEKKTKKPRIKAYYMLIRE